ncbi:MAG: hypothetical protein WA159_17285 [Variovorax sp.]
MISFSNSQAANLINAALSAEAIKLLGNANTDVKLAEQRAKSDAQYLLTLFTELTQSSEK